MIEVDFACIADENDSIAWVKGDDPRRFGVVEVDSRGLRRLIEPNDMNNNLAVVGCYYFRDGNNLLMRSTNRSSENRAAR